MSETKKCPYCGETITEDAEKCQHCGEMLTASTADNDGTKEKPGQPRKSFFEGRLWNVIMTILIVIAMFVIAGFIVRFFNL
ncbi:MAG: hypothetical protein IJK78_15870 [Bacteroidales bacterium]|nr:hypothetical protein [Bacteroidales bacterium]